MQPIAGQSTTNFTSAFLDEAATIISRLDRSAIDRCRFARQARQRKGRLFILGVGGSAANAAHAVNDFRKLAGIEA